MAAPSTEVPWSGGAASSSAGGAAAPGFRSYQGAFLARDAGKAFPRRARLRRGGPLGLRRGERGALRDGYDAALFAHEMVVVEEEGEAIRFVYERGSVAVLFWSDASAFEPVPLKPTRLALRPGVYPQGVAGDPGKDEVGVWVGPGWYEEPLRRQEGWAEVEVTDHDLRARGWLDTSGFGAVFTPRPVEGIRSHGGVPHGAWFVAGLGARVGRLAPLEGGEQGVSWWVEAVGPPVGALRPVRYAGERSWMRGYVAAALFQEPHAGMGFGRGGTGYGYATRTRLKLATPLRLENGAELFDGPAGDLCGMTRAPLPIPDRIPQRVEGGRREVEVSLGELGLVRLWVDPAKVAPAEAPAASASASARVPAR